MSDSFLSESGQEDLFLEQDNLTVSQELEGLRVDKALIQAFPHYSRAYFQKLIDEGLILVNGIKVKKSRIVSLADEIEVEFAFNEECDLTPENIPLDILYEDEHILAINKPAGLVVHPAPGNWTGTFVHALLFHCKSLEFSSSQWRPGIVHRLDKDTSGVLIAAKHLKAQKLLIEQFSQRKILKKYWAICIGHPADTGVIDRPIGRHPKWRKLMAIVETGKKAITKYHIRHSNGKLSWLDVDLETGRTHQIRVHLKSIGCPILGDSLYGIPQMNAKLKVKRQLLHAYSLQLIHPLTHQPIHIIANPPEDFVAWKKQLQAFSLS